MKTYKFEDVIGKTIRGITVKESTDGGSPKHQVFFEFEDGSYFEVYSDSTIQPVKLGFGGREAVSAYMGPKQRIVFQTDL